MSWRTAKAALDWALTHSDKRFRILFQGEGETTLALRLMQKCYEYARSRCQQLHKELLVTVTTNGLLSPTAVNWLKGLGSALELYVSFDGPPSIQNAQRPLKGGRPSWPIVWRTIQSLKRVGIPFTVKTSVTSEGRMPGLVRYFHKLGIKTIHMGGIVEEGRCIPTGTRATNRNKFFQKFTRAFELAHRLGIDLAPMWSLRLINACDACRVLTVTTRGYIAACLGILESKDAAADIFLYGRIVAGRVVIDEQKLRYLRSRTVDRLNTCRKCFAKWNCGGGCALAAFRKSGSIFAPETSFCDVIRKSTVYMLDKVLRSSIAVDNKCQQASVCV